MIRIIEVGPRDGLQNENIPVPTNVKAELVSSLIASGLREIEVTSFVSPKWVPQLGDAAELLSLIPKGGEYSALVPNEKGLARALETGIDRIALFTAASDSFTQKNINMSIAESLCVFREIANGFRAARPEGWIRGYVSTAFQCPYEGRIAPTKVIDVVHKLIEIGVDEVSIGDTIGVAVPIEVKVLTKELLQIVSKEKIAYHFHDTRGTAIANIAAALEFDIAAFDSSAGGLGGCPYAPGAGGNLATEDLIYFLERSGIRTGVDPVLLAESTLPILELLHRRPASKAQLAILAEHRSRA